MGSILSLLGLSSTTTATTATVATTGATSAVGATGAAGAAATAGAAGVSTTGAVVAGSTFTVMDGLELAFAGLSGLSSYQTAQEQEDAQKKYNEELQQQAIQQYYELDKSESDILHNEFAKSLEARKMAMKARSTVELESAASGTYGKSIDTAMNDINAGLENKLSNIVFEKDRQLDQISNQAKDIRGRTGVNSDKTIRQPAWYKGVTSGLQTYSSVKPISKSLYKTYKESRTIQK